MHRCSPSFEQTTLSVYGPDTGEHVGLNGKQAVDRSHIDERKYFFY